MSVTIDRAEVIRMAREAGCTANEANAWGMFLERFAALVAAAAIKDAPDYKMGYADGVAVEREDIAEMFDEPMRLVPFVQNHLGGCMVCGFTPAMVAQTIRARGNT